MSEITMWCENCGMSDIVICDCKKDDLNKNPWFDILCHKCRLVLCTCEAKKEGKVIFKIEDK